MLGEDVDKGGHQGDIRIRGGVDSDRDVIPFRFEKLAPQGRLGVSEGDGVNDTIKLDLESGKMEDFIKFETGNLAMISGGKNTGRVGVIVSRERHQGSFDIVHIKDSVGHVFATRLGNVFVIGEGTKPLVSLPKRKGIKMTILEERALRPPGVKTSK